VFGVLFAMLAEFIQFQAGLENFFILMRMMRHALATCALQLDKIVLGHKFIF